MAWRRMGERLFVYSGADARFAVPWEVLMGPEEREILRRSTVMVAPGAAAPPSRSQALELLDELDRLAGFERRVRELVGEMRRVALGRQGQDGRAPE